MKKEPKQRKEKTQQGLFLSKKTTLNSLISKLNFAKVPLTVVKIKNCLLFEKVFFLQVTIDLNIYNNHLPYRKTCNFPLHEK